MADYTVDPYMGFLTPTPSVDPGPAYATHVSNALTTIGAHGHTGGGVDGKQLGSAAINVDADLSWNSNFSLTNVKATKYTSQAAVLAGVGDVNCVYVKGGNLYYNNASGTPVQITTGTTVNVAGSNTIWTFKAVSSNWTIVSTDTDVYYAVDTSAARTFTLPTAASVAAGRRYWIADVTGSAGTNAITINKSGTDVIDGATSTKVVGAYGGVVIVSNGVDKWHAEHVFNTQQGRLAFGTVPALTGAIAFSSNSALKYRDSGLDKNLVSASGTQIQFGDDASGGDTTVSGQSSVQLSVNGTPVVTVTAGAVDLANKFSINGTGIGFFGVAPTAISSTYTVTNPSTDRALNVTADTLAQGLAVLGTLIADLKTKGLIG